MPPAQLSTAEDQFDESPILDPRDNYRERLKLLDMLVEHALEASPSDADLDNLVKFFRYFERDASRLRWHDGNRT